MESGLAQISATELDEWIAFDSLEPIGARRSDIQVAMLGSVLANQWRGKDSKPLTPSDFLESFSWWRDEEKAKDAPPPKHWTVIELERLLAEGDE